MVDYEAWADVGIWLDIASGFLFIALAVVVGLVRPRRRVNIAFALFAAGFGYNFVVANLAATQLEVSEAVAYYALPPGRLAWIVGAAMLAFLFPRPLAPHERRALWLPIMVLVLHLVASLAISLVDWSSNGVQGAAGVPSWFVVVVNRPLHLVAQAASLFLLLVLAVRFHARGFPEAARFRQQCALVTAALMPFGALAAGAYFARGEGIGGGSLALQAPHLGVLILISLLWGWNAFHVSGRQRRWAIALAALAPALVLLGLIYAYATSVTHAINLGLLGAVRVFGVALLAYAIVRQQLFDLDIKIKWTVRASTVVGAFVAVFFVVSQLIQTMAGEVFGAVSGGIAAGLLLFALEPIRRFAERLSDRAMPRVKQEDPAYALERKRETYRSAYATAWSDGRLTPKDMRLLTEFREALGLPGEEYTRIEKEWAGVQAAR